MNFECLLLNAKAGNEDAITAILQMYRPLLLKYAIIDGECPKNTNLYSSAPCVGISQQVQRVRF